MTHEMRSRWSDPAPEDETMTRLLGESREPRASMCPSSDLVQAAEMGVLPPGLQERVAAHVDQCGMCRALGQALSDPSVGELTPEEQARALTRIRATVAAAPAADSGRRPWAWTTVAAASLLTVIAGSAVIWSLRSSPADVPPSDPSVLRLEKPGMTPGGGGGLVWRGTDAAGGDADLESALQSFRRDDFEEAVRRFSIAVDQQPQNALAHFYLGVSQLFMSSPSKAIAALENAERLVDEDERLTGEVVWYLAVAYQRTGQYERAATRLEALCRRQGNRTDLACAALREMKVQPSGTPPR